MFVCLAAFALWGCTRADYRKRADRETYRIVTERQFDPRWQIPDRPVEPAAQSRFGIASDIDRGPTPPDDPAARQYLVQMCLGKAHHLWPKRGELVTNENPVWRDFLDRDDKGAVVLDRASTMTLALAHSREYQDQVEAVYLRGLQLSLQRFEYAVRWSGGSRVFFEHSGSDANDRNNLNVDSNLGFAKNLASGGQLVVDFANNLFFEFSGRDINFASSSLLVELTQPLLRGASRRIRQETLNLSERQTLYQVRQFARFRRQFYVQLEGSGGYLGLLSQLQGIRNIEANLESLRQNLREHEELAKAGLVAPIQVDQVFQQFQQGRFSLLSARAGLETALDNYKIMLGLPPDLDVRLDDKPLAMFELSDPRLDQISDRNDDLYLKLLQPDTTPPIALLQSVLADLKREQAELGEVLGKLEGEYAKWKARPVEEEPPSTLLPSENRQRDRDRQALRQTALGKTLEDIRSALTNDQKRADKLEGEIAKDPAAAWDTLRELVGLRFRERAGDTFVTQTEVRAQLIALTPLKLDRTEATQIALENRLDLMNEKARVMDAWRAVEVAGNALQAGLNLRFQGDLRTDPEKDNPIRFDASASRFRVGMEFDGPLNRKQERNVFRAAQIVYQQARRQYLESEDGVRAQIRLDLRNLEANRLQFEIGRQQLIAAARQVDQAQFNLRTKRESDSSVTQDLLGALQTLLNAKNNLIDSWVNYETSRMNLYRDLDFMEIDAQGAWINEQDQPALDVSVAPVTPGAAAESAELPKTVPLPAGSN